MATTLLDSLASFLGTLARSPHPDAVAASLVDCFHDTLATRMAAILPARPPVLVVYGLHGYAENAVQGFDAIGVDDDYPATRAYREAEACIDPIDAVIGTYAGPTRPDSRSRAIVDKVPGGWSAAAPLMQAGTAIGAISLVCAREVTWGPAELATLSAVGNALGMWLTHPDSGLPSVDPLDRPVLTSRQGRILALAEGGATTAAIAAALGYSESTVKQDLQRAMRVLGAPSRAAAVGRARDLGLLEER